MVENVILIVIIEVKKLVSLIRDEKSLFCRYVPLSFRGGFIHKGSNRARSSVSLVAYSKIKANPMKNKYALQTTGFKYRKVLQSLMRKLGKKFCRKKNLNFFFFFICWKFKFHIFFQWSKVFLSLFILFFIFDKEYKHLHVENVRNKRAGWV